MATPRDPPRSATLPTNTSSPAAEVPVGVQAESTPDSPRGRIRGNSVRNAGDQGVGLESMAHASVAKQASADRAVGVSHENVISSESNAAAAGTRRARGAQQAQEVAQQAQEVAQQAARSSHSSTRDSDRSPANPEADPVLRSVPESVKARYLKVGDDYHFVNGTLAFRDKGERLSTPLENAEVIRDLIAIAQERGWREIAIAGNARFRSEAYQQARLIGLEVRGYTPEEAERKQLAHRMRLRDGREPTPSADTVPAVPEVSRPEAVEQPQQNRRDLEDTRQRVHRGRLVDHGAASYRFDPREEESYFLLIGTQRGEEYVWGKDLQRAIESSLSRARAGQEVVVRESGSEPVTVSRPVRDEEGRVTDQVAVRTQRRRWTVETEEFLAERQRLAEVIRDAQVTPTDGVLRHPELAGTYDELYTAKLVAANQNYTKDEADRFINRIRESIAQEIERGEPLSPPVQRARYRGDTQSPRSHQHVQERVL